MKNAGLTVPEHRLEKTKNIMIYGAGQVVKPCTVLARLSSHAPSGCELDALL